MSEGSLEFHPMAVEEAEAAYDWYARRSNEAAGAFLVELERAFELIQQSPATWPEYGEGARRFLLRRYPFNVVYQVHEDRIVVLGVAHARRRPGYWKGRT